MTEQLHQIAIPMTYTGLSLGGLAMFVTGQDPGKKSQVFAPRPGGVGEENVENFPGWGLSRLTKMYKFSPKRTNSLPKWAKVSKFSAMARQKSKFGFQTFPAKHCLRKKTDLKKPNLSFH